MAEFNQGIFEIPLNSSPHLITIALRVFVDSGDVERSNVRLFCSKPFIISDMLRFGIPDYCDVNVQYVVAMSRMGHHDRKIHEDRDLGNFGG